MRQHIDTVGMMFMAYGILQLVLAALIGLGIAGLGGMLGALGVSAGDGELMFMGGLYGGLGAVVAVMMVVFAVPYVVVGGGIRRRASWARIGGLVLGAMALMSMPIGTMLGIFAFVTLLDTEAAEEFV